MPLTRASLNPPEVEGVDPMGPDKRPIATKDDLGMGWKLMPAMAAAADGISTYGLLKGQPWKEEINPLFSPIKGSPEALLATKLLMGVLGYTRMEKSKHTKNPSQRKREALIMSALPALASILNAYQVANKPPTTGKLE